MDNQIKTASEQHAVSGQEVMYTLDSIERQLGKEARKLAKQGIDANRISVLYSGNGSRFKFWGSSFFRYCAELEATREEHRKREATPTGS